MLLDRGALDTATAVGSLVLTAVGIAGVILAYWTLRAIKRQANLMEQSNKTAQTAAEAALAQTQAMVDKERARVFVEAPRGTGTTVDLSTRNGVIGGNEFALFNVGPTPAINVIVSYHAVATEFEGETNNKTAWQARAPEVIGANSKESVYLEFRPAFVSNLAHQSFFIHVFGMVEYSDVISPKRRKKHFRFRTQMRSRGNGSALQTHPWERFGTAEENSGD